MKPLSVIHFSFLPTSADAGILALRMLAGIPMLALHGWGKMVNFSTVSENFPALVGGSTFSLALAVFAEVICAGLLALGLLTRFAALNLVVTMAVAFFIVHGGALSGEKSGEMAFMYLAMYLVLMVTGAGKYSVDAKLGLDTTKA